MTIETKIITNINFEYLLKLFTYFNVKFMLNCTDYTHIIEFYNNKKLVGFVSYIYEMSKYILKPFIKLLYYNDEEYLNEIANKLIELKINNYKIKHIAPEIKHFFINDITDFFFKKNRVPRHPIILYSI